MYSAACEQETQNFCAACEQRTCEQRTCEQRKYDDGAECNSNRAWQAQAQSSKRLASMFLCGECQSWPWVQPVSGQEGLWHRSSFRHIPNAAKTVHQSMKPVQVRQRLCTLIKLDKVCSVVPISDKQVVFMGKTLSITKNV